MPLNKIATFPTLCNRGRPSRRVSFRVSEAVIWSHIVILTVLGVGECFFYLLSLPPSFPITYTMAKVIQSNMTLPVGRSIVSENVLGIFLPDNVIATVATVITALLTFLYCASIRRPIPGVPYTKKSRWNPFGDAVDFVQYTKNTGEGFRWFATKAAALNSPIFQVFLGPFSKPVVVLADIQELIDMSSRRTKEFDRGGFLSGWVGILFPEGTISMPSHDKFKDQRNIWSSTMTSQFLNSVSAKTIHHHTSSLIELWKAKFQRANGRPFEVSDDIKQVTFDMVGKACSSSLFLFGSVPNRRNSKDNGSFTLLVY